MAARRTEGHVPLYESGSGQYSKSLGRVHQKISESEENALIAFIDQITVDDPKGVVTLGDFGTADGSVSMETLITFLRRIRENHGEDLAIQIIFEDQEKNDFNSLFKHIADDSSFMTKFTNVYPFATNVNFYKQCVPNNTFHVLAACACAHWLETTDFSFKDCVFHFSPEARPEEREVFQKTSARDWNKFLLLRGREMRKYGFMLIWILCRDPKQSLQESGSPVPKDYEFTDITFQDVELAWRRLREEGAITQEEYSAANIQVAVRSSKELLAPFMDANSEVRKSGMSLAFHNVIPLPAAYDCVWREKLEKEGVDDRQLFGEFVTSAQRVWSECTFLGSLSDSRTKEEKAALMDRLYAYHTQQVLKTHPDQYHHTFTLCRMVITKE